MKSPLFKIYFPLYIFCCRILTDVSKTRWHLEEDFCRCFAASCRVWGSFFTPQKFKCSHQKLIKAEVSAGEDAGAGRSSCRICVCSFSQCGAVSRANCSVCCLRAAALTSFNPRWLFVLSMSKKCLAWDPGGEVKRRVVPHLWRCHSHLFFLELDAETWALPGPPRGGEGGFSPRFVCSPQRKWFVLWVWQLVFVPESEATMRESGAKPVTMMDELKQSCPPSLARFPHSCLPWQPAAAAHRRRERRAPGPQSTDGSTLTLNVTGALHRVHMSESVCEEYWASGNSSGPLWPTEQHDDVILLWCHQAYISSNV